jgi:hypothetical protein
MIQRLALQSQWLGFSNPVKLTAAGFLPAALAGSCDTPVLQDHSRILVLSWLGSSQYKLQLAVEPQPANTQWQ